MVSSGGFLSIRRRAKRKRARIFESSGIGSSDDLAGVGSFSPSNGAVDNCAVNDCNISSSENGETVDIIIGDVNRASNNVVGGAADNSCVASHNTASINDNSSDNNISCFVFNQGISCSVSDNSQTSNMLIAVRMAITLVVIVIVVILLITLVIIIMIG